MTEEAFGRRSRKFLLSFIGTAGPECLGSACVSALGAPEKLCLAELLSPPPVLEREREGGRPCPSVGREVCGRPTRETFKAPTRQPSFGLDAWTRRRSPSSIATIPPRRPANPPCDLCCRCCWCTHPMCDRFILGQTHLSRDVPTIPGPPPLPRISWAAVFLEHQALDPICEYLTIREVSKPFRILRTRCVMLFLPYHSAPGHALHGVGAAGASTR
jgi:hypothetical protein